MAEAGDTVEQAERGSPFEVLLVATRLGLTSFGGPVAHLGYFHNEYVERRRWLTPETYAEVVALTQALPGPASSQVGIAVGLIRAGVLGAVLAWIGFTLPSAAAILALSLETALAQVAIILLSGVVGWRLFFVAGARPGSRLPVPVGRNLALGAGALFLLLLFGLPLAASAADTHALDVFDSFYRVGSLVFGGGHVVLPLLEREVVAPGWMTEDQFLAGYGAAQAVPGPLFTLSAYLGAVMGPEPNGVLGATIALCAIFLPSFLLIFAGLHAWSLIRQNPSVVAALQGVNAGVVGLLLAALYRPVITSSVQTAEDFSIALAAFGLLAFWRTPPWLIVAFAAVAAVLVDEL